MADPTVSISLKNGGGIRAEIGTVDVDGNLLSPPANPEVGKEEGDVSALDVVNSLRFNNGLSLLTLTATELKEVLEHGFAESSFDPSVQEGRFPQVGGIRVVVDYTQPAGSRILEAALIDENEQDTLTIIENGMLAVPDTDEFRIVTLDFLADGGDGYPYPDLSNPNRVDLETVLTDTMNFNFADPGSEQDAFAEYFNANFSMTPFDRAETPADEDTRILFTDSVARVQVVHNSPTPGGGPTAVDVYINDLSTPALDSFTYRTATPFIDVPIGATRIVVAPNGEADPENNNVFDATVNLLGLDPYVVIANGVAGDPMTPFTLAINDMAREAAEDPANVEFAAFHGSPDAPAVDVDARGVADELIDNLAYNEFTDYIGVPPAAYILDVRVNDDPNIAGTFLADLSGLGGGAATVFASGFLGQDPGFGLFAALPDGSVVEFPAASFANANVIHASPAAAADSVDVYLDTVLAIDNFPYLASTGYIQLPTNVDISVNTKGSTGPNDGVVLTIPANTLENAKDYIVIVHGDGDTEPIEVAFIDTARTSSTQPGLEDVIAFHAIPGLGAVDVRDGSDLPDFGTLIDGLGYGEFSDYLSVPADSYFFRFTGDDNASPIATFLTAIDSADEAGILVATGLPDSDPLFNLYYYLPDGRRFAATTASLIQLIHNSPAADFPVDVLALDDNLSGFILAEGLDYTGATTFEYFLTRSSWDYYVGPQGFTSLAEVIVTFEDVELEDGRDYTAVVYGDGETATPLSLAVLDTSRLVEASGSVFDLMLFHGSPDAGPVDVSALGMPVLDDFAYGTFEGYLPIPLNIPVQLDVTNGDGSEDYGSYIATFSDWTAAGYSAGTAYATGYLDPDMDQPGFELWIAFWDGTTEMLERLVNVEEVEETLSAFSIFPNPMRTTGTVQYSLEQSTQLQGNLFDANGRLIRSENLGNLSAGMYTHQLNVADLPNGTYYYQLRMGDASVTKRFIVTK
jgi:hypothetical protein